MAKYLKLGDGANTFHDPTTGVNLSNKQVIRILNDLDIQKPSLRKAMREGHLVKATKDEWEEYKAENAQQVEESQKNLKVVKTVTTTSVASASPSRVAAAGNFVDEDSDEDDEDADDDDTTQVNLDEEDEDLTKSQLIDKLKESTLIKEEEKKSLTKATIDQLRGLWKSVKPKS